MIINEELWSEDTFVSFDGIELFYRFKKPAQTFSHAVLVLHRGHEHSGRVISLIEELAFHDAWYFAFDLRGHGHSPGERGWAPSFETWVKDLNAFASHICSKYELKTEDMFVIANSVGSVMAITWVHDYAPAIRGMVLAAPALSINLYIPFALPALRLLLKFKKDAFVTSYVRSHLLTRDPVEAKAYNDDKLITKRIAVSVLVSLNDLSRRILSDAQSIDTPTLILSAGSDFVVNTKIQKAFFDRISSPIKDFIALKGYRHALFHEKDRDIIVEHVRIFMQRCFISGERLLPTIIPEPRPHTVSEHNNLTATPMTAKAIYYHVFRCAMELIGRYSHGIALGLDKGFDSGASLDYIYKNTPAGTSCIGRVFDQLYLRSIGWRGIRHRKEQLIETLKNVLETLHARDENPIVLDMAAGYGRYLFETVRDVSFPVILHLRDLYPENLQNAEVLAQEYGVTTAFFTTGNAFDQNDLSKIKIRPNVIIISGLFELYDNNPMVQSTLKVCSQLLTQGGYLIYTGQPWHPQIEMIGRVLNNHLGKRWIMRRRVQAEMDELVKCAGLVKLETIVEDHGIFTVSVSQKRTV